MRFLFMLVVVGLGCGEPHKNSSVKNVFGKDDRTRLATNSLPGSAVGRLESGCTGFLVGKNLAVTAAHCIIDPTTRSIKSGIRNFDLAYENGVARRSSWIVGAWLGSSTPEEERRNDWAIVWLADDLGSQAGWLGVSSEGVQVAELPKTVQLVGYASDIDSGNYPVGSGSCYIHRQDDEQRLLHDCDAGKGTSGGPVLQGQDQVVAITVSEFIDQGSSQSQQRESYSHDYANIAVNAAHFYPTLALLRSTVEQDLSPPTGLAATYVANTNSMPGLESPAVVPGPGTNPSQDATQPSPVQESLIYTNRVRINHQTIAMIHIVQETQRQAVAYNDFVQLAVSCHARLDAMASTSHRLNIGLLSTKDAAAAIAREMNALSVDSQKLFNAYANLRLQSFAIQVTLDKVIEDYRGHLRGLSAMVNAYNR